MYFKIKKEKLKKIFDKSIINSKNVKNLIKNLNIQKSSLYLYKNNNRLIPKKVLTKLLNISKEKIEKQDIIEVFPNNWKQIKGGRNCVKKKKENNTFEKQIRECQLASSIYMKEYHKKCKNIDPEKYYKSQYEKFKKIGNYKFNTKKGEKVRNTLELETANYLYDNNLPYLYEPYIKIKNHCFFPDFLIKNKIIIECTSWKGYDKAIKLKKKIRHLKNKYEVFILVPKALNKYYKILNNHLINELDENVPLAQFGRASDC